jgi:hypothetical protein
MDFMVEREAFSETASELIDICLKKRIARCVAAHTIPNLYFILRKHMSTDERAEALLNICTTFKVIGIDAEKIKSALRNKDFKDFEDCLQDECAKEFEADYIVTRNLKDFEASVVPAIEPIELLRIINQSEEK